MVRSSRTMKTINCETWNDLIAQLRIAWEVLAPNDGELLWFRGCQDASYKLEPTLMRDTKDLSDRDHDLVERDLFFEFQALARELRHQGLKDWEYLFYARHFGLPTRVLDWTDTFGVALYFALEGIALLPTTEPAICIINPYALNHETLDERDITLPRYLGVVDDEYLDFGEMLAANGKWAWDGPVAIYPIQLNDRVRAQRGWFTIHGNDRRSLDEQFPAQVIKLILGKNSHDEIREFLELAGFNRFSIYPDLDNLAGWARDKNLRWADKRRAIKTARLR